MKTSRFMTLVSAAIITGALMTPSLASAHGRHDRWHHERDHRWSASPSWHEKRHYRHRHHRDKVRIDVDSPRRWSRPSNRAPAIRYDFGNGLTIIYR